MDETQLLNRFVRAIKQPLIIDLIDRLPQEAFRAHEMVKNESGLEGRSARELTGQARFRMMEKGFVDENVKHGGLRLDADIMPGIGEHVFQPFYIYGDAGERVVLGLATISEPSKLPGKNRSRGAAVQLNYRVLPTLDFEGTSPKAGDIFVLFLVARDPQHGGMIKEMAIGVIDALYQQYIAYVPIEKLLALYSTPTPTTGGDGSPSVGLKLKVQPEKFVGPEQASDKPQRGDRKL